MSKMDTPTAWDKGQATLAALGYDGFALARAFGAWLHADSKRMKPKSIKAEDEHGRMVRRKETEDEVLKRLAKAFCIQRGIRPQMEEAVEVDPETGDTSNPNGVKRARRVDMLEVWHKQGQISAKGFTAAIVLRNTFEETGRTPSVDLAQERVDSSPKPDHSVTIQIERLSRFHAVNRFVAAEDREIIDACVLRGTSFLCIKRYRGRGYAAGLRHLHDALDRLADAMSS